MLLTLRDVAEGRRRQSSSSSGSRNSISEDVIEVVVVAVVVAVVVVVVMVALVVVVVMVVVVRRSSALHAPVQPTPTPAHHTHPCHKPMRPARSANACCDLPAAGLSLPAWYSAAAVGIELSETLDISVEGAAVS